MSKKVVQNGMKYVQCLNNILTLNSILEAKTKQGDDFTLHTQSKEHHQYNFARNESARKTGKNYTAVNLTEGKCEELQSK